jgi:16S rRNA (guanine527-N7)-methyltransferase
MSQEAVLSAALAEGMKQLGLTASLEVQARLLDYVRLLRKWNGVYNLTAVRDPAEMVTRHLLDSLAVLPHVQGPRILDVGSGAGLPGIPLALMAPAWQFTLLDSNSKKTRFIRQAISELGLENAEAVHDRIEAFQPTAGFDTVVSRAFATIADFVHQAGHCCTPDGVILAMKGQLPEAELADVPEGYSVAGVHRLQVPGLQEERHVVCLQRTSL